tara:strand:- start:110 stop:1390 length:1281 start_codon:yes stop_codon:yes gene_type:complete
MLIHKLADEEARRAEPAALTSADAFAQACGKLRDGDAHACIALLDDLLHTVGSNNSDAARITRAQAFEKLGRWDDARSDYERFIKQHDKKRGKQLANAHYGCALCHAKRGQPLQALVELDKCLAAAPNDDEQMTERSASMAPRARVARYVLLQQAELRQQYRRSRGATRRATAAVPAMQAINYAEPTLEGRIWRVQAKQLEDALHEAREQRRTTLLLDPSPVRPVDSYFMYGDCTIVHAKQLVLEVRGAGVPVEEARDGLRKSLVHAMRWGHTLVIRMADSAADFVGSYCTDDCFPTRLFDGATLPSGSEIARSGSAWAKVLRPCDLESGRFFVPSHFRVCVTSVFDAGKFEQRLGDALPLDVMQPVLVQPTFAAMESEGGTSSSNAADRERATVGHHQHGGPSLGGGFVGGWAGVAFLSSTHDMD